LKESPANIKSNVKFVLATDGESFEAENVDSGERIVCEYSHFSNYFGFFLPLAGISTVREISENTIDIQATVRLDKLYVNLINKANYINKI